MNPVTRGGGLERFRSYLWLPVEIQFDLRLQGKFGPSDLVPQTLLQAPKAEAGLHGMSDRAKAAWLRQSRARNPANALRDLSWENRVKLISEKSLIFPVPKMLARAGNSSWEVSWTTTPATPLTSWNGPGQGTRLP
jgi:hypothetical protein